MPPYEHVQRLGFTFQNLEPICVITLNDKSSTFHGFGNQGVVRSTTFPAMQIEQNGGWRNKPISWRGMDHEGKLSGVPAQ